MDCEGLREELSAYVDHELDPEDRARVEAHLGVCELCAEEVASYRTIKSLVARSRLRDEPPPETLHVVPDVIGTLPAPDEPHLSWLHRPIRARHVVFAAAAVLVGLFVGWRGYESRYVRNTLQRDVVMAHLHGVAAALPSEPEQAMTVSLRPIDDQVYARPEGLATVGHLMAFQTVYFMGPRAISQLRFNAGDFDDAGLEPQTVGGRSYRVGCQGDYSIASYRRGPVQIVLVSDAPPEALLLLAQNIPPDTPFNLGGTGY